MNRTIKFRGKSIESRKNGQWIYGCYLSDHDGYSYHELILDSTTGFSYEVDPITVSQFTGLYDKNGKEIYEGDILLVGNDGYENTYNKVGIKDGCFGYVGETNGEILPFCHYNVTEEIVGNIYDHPQLIKEE
jgi:uncharacterized phage protein (TIGR01671 family)|nr:MAG TPA: YopX protein [Caudoviricetes sp.]